jgi:hypothetical protein
MWTWILPLLVSSATAAECPERITPEAFRTRIEAVREPVAFADPMAQGQIDDLLALMESCINGPVRRQDIAALFLARGAWEILAGTESDWHQQLARDHLTWAYAVGSRDAWEPMYGPQVEEVFDEVSSSLLEKGVLDLTFRSVPEVMVLDGEVVREQGRRFVTAGAHLVQWKDGQGWHGEIIRLAPEETKTIGGGRASREGGARGGGREKKSAYRVKWGPQPTGHVNAMARIGADLVRVGHETGALKGGHLFPGARVEGQLFVYRAVSVRVAAGMGPGAREYRPPEGREALLGVGFGQRTETLFWDFTVGGAYKVVASPVSQLQWPGDPKREGPVFRQVGVPAAVVSGHVARKQNRIDAHVSLARLNASGDLGLGLEARGRKVLGEGKTAPILGVHAGRFSRPGASKQRSDVYRFVVLEGGLTWSY